MALNIPLSNSDKKQLRSIGHKLKPVVIIAQKGMTENIRVEIDRALKDHELIKVKLLAADKKEKQAVTESLCEELSAECVQSVGHMILIYRAARKPDPRLSNLQRKLGK